MKEEVIRAVVERVLLDYADRVPFEVMGAVVGAVRFDGLPSIVASAIKDAMEIAEAREERTREIQNEGVRHVAAVQAIDAEYAKRKAICKHLVTRGVVTVNGHEWRECEICGATLPAAPVRTGANPGGSTSTTTSTGG